MTITRLTEDEVLNQKISDEELENISGGRFDGRSDDNDHRLTGCSMNLRADPSIIMTNDLIR